mmetsp:Transcript_17196/g.49750  ORF Transcript_17196/g.49750 Transcript_17196/m.49750 type:complete len:942 (-) Transcript_17196:70-2895(-)
MDHGAYESSSQIYESRGREASLPGEAFSAGTAVAHHQLQGGSVRDSRMHNRYEDPREHGRYGSSRSAAGGQKNRKGLLGLSNLGNTCFMNAALQCLTHTHGMQKYFRMCSHEYASKTDAASSRGPTPRQKLLLSFAHWFERDWAKNVSASFHSPEDILRAVQQLNPMFQGYTQQDAQEFLRCVLDNMHEELRREIPDELHSRFGVDLCPGAALGGGGSSSSTGGPDGSADSRHAARSGGDADPVSPKSRSASAASQLMQLCQATEGVTDVGEIRLPAAKPPAPPPTNAGPPAGNAASASPGSAWESGSAVSSSSAATTPSAAAPQFHGAAALPQRGGGKEGEGGEKKERNEGEKPSHFSSIVSDLFQGHVVSTVRCLECNRVSRTKEPFQDVSVQIPSPNELANGQTLTGSPVHDMSAPEIGAHGGASGSAKGPTFTGMLGNVTGKVKSWFYDKGVEITDCLRKFCAPEYLVGKDKYDCDHCKRKTDGERRFAFKDLPEVLCIHIKRFRYDASWFNATKNSRVVTFPVNRTLDMGPFLEDPVPYPVEYRLIGLIQHIGSMGGGHYISYCQHKRKPQDWYEFDDIQVNQVSAETVERAEPYVLFFQRIPSKGSKLDRQTFKSDHGRMQARIRDYLMCHPPPTPPGITPGSHLSGMGRHGSGHGSEEAVAEEMRFHGPALRTIYRSPPSELDMVFVTKRWYVKLTTMSHPGPLDNYQFLCPHRLLGCASVDMAAEPFIPISRALCQSLMQKYGGGPVVDSMEVCAKCQAHLRAYNDRKQAEYDLVSKYDTKDTGDGKAWYLVDAVWVNKWKCYIKADHVMDIRDMMQPGPVSNGRLCDRKTGQIRSGLKLRIDYIGVNARVWWLFKHLHGGGPAICREDLDIYSAEHRLETELKLEELKPIGDRAELSRRMRHEFVDECKGDTELFLERYGQGVGGGAPDSRD